jgi:hypothetical protein
MQSAPRLHFNPLPQANWAKAVIKGHKCYLNDAEILIYTNPDYYQSNRSLRSKNLPPNAKQR